MLRRPPANNLIHQVFFLVFHSESPLIIFEAWLKVGQAKSEHPRQKISILPMCVDGEIKTRHC